MSKEKNFFIAATVIIVIIIFVSVNLNRLFPTPVVEFPSNLYVDTEFNVSSGTNPGAKVTFIEFGDFSCPHCKDAVEIVEQLRDYYGNDVNFVFKHLPRDDNSVRASLAAECARDKGVFWEYHDILFENQPAFELEDLEEYAEEVGIDKEEMLECIKSGEKADIISDDMKDAMVSEVRGTPTFFIDGIRLEGTQDFLRLKSLIDRSLEED